MGDLSKINGTCQAELQKVHHTQLFGALYAWETARDRIAGLSGDPSFDGLLGLDQMGHFGPHGCDLVTDEILATRWSRVALCELGSGFGGALRHLTHCLHAAGVAVPRAVGVELVAEHCALARRISDSLHLDGVVLQADVGRLPFRAGAFDAVVATGSVPHFPDMRMTLREAARVVRPGGLVVLTEEVSLVGDDSAELPGEFLALHPPQVFFTATLAERAEHLRASGLEVVRDSPLTSWAMGLLDARLKAIKLFKGSIERIYGVEEVARIVGSLRITRDLYAAGTLVPRLTVARRP